MKIALFTNTFTPHVGGVANSVAALVKGMRERGHQCLVVAPEFDDQPEEEQEVLRVPSIRNFNGTDFSFRLPSGTLIGDAVKDFGPDLIHSHHPFLLGDAAMRLAHQWDLPLVFTHHTRYENYVHYVLRESEWLERLAIELATEYANLCDQVIAPSESIAVLLRERGVETAIDAIPTGIDPDRFGEGCRADGRREFDLAEGDFVVGHIGRLAEEKNLPFLTGAICHYLADTPDARFLLVGEGDASAGIREMVEQRGLTDRVRLGGKLKGRKLVDAYHAMDVFAFASQSETQGMVLAEAMAAGVPVVALDASGSRDIVRDGQNGALLDADASARDFAAAIAELRKRREADPQCFSEPLAEAARRFSVDNCLDRMEAVYRRLVEADTRKDDLPGWTRFMSRMEAEWDLATSRARAVGAAFKKSK
jgi:glycosyltransferase involved in cell wall biosynthesis